MSERIPDAPRPQGSPGGVRAHRAGIAVATLALALLGFGFDAKATRKGDPPHWTSPSGTPSINCTVQCHTGHQAAGGTLTVSASNVNLCQSCHRPSTGVGDNPVASALKISNSDKAVPGVSGNSHGFDVAPVNAALGTRAPTNLEMSLRMIGGQVVCSTCHNQHASDPFLTGATPRGGTPRVSPANKTTTLGSTGTLTTDLATGTTYLGNQGYWYLIQIVTAGSATTARFGFSKDSGATWFPANCTPGGTITGCLTASTAPVALDNNVTIAFVNGAGPTQFALNERWELSAAFPLLRAPLDDVAGASAFCSDCHNAWTMSHASVETWDNTFKSHPVGILLNANGHGYDRSTPLDANGGVQGASPDNYPANDLRLDSTGNVQCITCHSPHFAPGNSAAVVP